MDTLLLSRVQFGFTIGFHILFPTLTIGLAWFLVIFETQWRRTKRQHWIDLYFFWTKIFALTFGMGVVSGIVLSYQVGTNFSRFSEIVGPVIGPLLSAEVLTAFFVEAGFLGIMLFGWKKVGPGLHYVATILVAVGTTNSAFWIISANSFLHTPQGASFLDGRLVPVDWLAVIFNPSFPYRLAHMLLAAVITSSLVVAGGSAWCLRNGRYRDAGLTGLRTALTLLAIAAPLQILAGDQHGLEVRHYQPMKVAAMEGLWQTGSDVPLVAFAWPDQAAQTNRFAIEIPHLASLILTHEWGGEVKGLNEVPRDLQPPVLPVFFGFRLMVALGVWFVLLAAWGTFARLRGKLEQSSRLHLALMASMPLGFVATVTGWIVAETGRQPWLVHSLLLTADGVSPLPAANVAVSLALFVLVYGVLMCAYLFFVLMIVRRGPELPAKQPEAMRGGRPGELVPESSGDGRH